MSAPLMTVLTVMLTDTFFEGFILMPAAGYDFKNGIECALSFTYISGEDGSLLTYFNDKKIITLRISYEY